MATYLEIKRQIAALEKKAAEARKKELAEVIAAIQQQIDEYGLTPADLFTRRRQAGPVAPAASAAKPATGRARVGRKATAKRATAAPTTAKKAGARKAKSPATPTPSSDVRPASAEPSPATLTPAPNWPAS